jgi:hypothetical protein
LKTVLTNDTRELARPLLIHMKNKIIFAIAFLALTVLAHMTTPFNSWDELISKSSNIAVVRCDDPTRPVPSVATANGPQSDMAINTIYILKGTNTASNGRLFTDTDLCPGNSYLLFGNYDNGVYQAYEDYRIVPLGKCFITNQIAGKALNEQIQILLQVRYDNLKREMQQNEEERQRLEVGLIELKR